jgi:multiple antibiotic resistance protein
MVVPYARPVDILSAAVTLFLVLDPLGNIPLFLSTLRAVAPERRRRVLLREIGFAYIVLVGFALFGDIVLRWLGLEQATIGISGGIVLFLIAIRMIFPAEGGGGEQIAGEPFLVPLAIPLLAGPSSLAMLLLLEESSRQKAPLLAAVTIAWALSGAILLSSGFFYRVLRERGLVAMERLMGMLLVMIAVQMFMNGIKAFPLR